LPHQGGDVAAVRHVALVLLVAQRLQVEGVALGAGQQLRPQGGEVGGVAFRLWKRGHTQGRR
jgi:hypothetical protein